MQHICKPRMHPQHLTSRAATTQDLLSQQMGPANSWYVYLT